jgi:HlyD family secretion protein
LNPVVLVSVGSQVSGIVQKLYADFNGKVKAGQVLLELDPTLNRAQLQQSAANLSSAQASLDLARANEERARGLFAQEYVTRQDLDVAVQALKAAKAQYAVAQAQVVRDQRNVDNTVIRSPVSGVVVSRLVDVGQTVAASLQSPTLFTIAQDLSHMQIDTSYAEADVGNIRVGQQASFRVDAFPNRTFRGVVKQVRLNPTTQQNVVTYDVVVSVENLDQALMPGMTAYVNIVVAERKDVLMVPNAALRFRPVDAAKARVGGDKPKGDGRGKGDTTPMGTVYVLENGQPKAARISVGITDNKLTEVLAGELKDGDSVIIEDRQPPAKASGGTGMRLF